MSDSASREKSGQRSRWLWFLVAGCLLITLIGLFLLTHQLPWWILLGPLAICLAAANGALTLRYVRRRARGPS